MRDFIYDHSHWKYLETSTKKISVKQINQRNNSVFVSLVHLWSVFEEIVVRSHDPEAIIIGQPKAKRPCCPAQGLDCCVE